MAERPMIAVADRLLITRVAVCNYESIAARDVTLAALTIAVGPNGVGKAISGRSAYHGGRVADLGARLTRAAAVSRKSAVAWAPLGAQRNTCHRRGAQPIHFGILLDFQLAKTLGL